MPIFAHAVVNARKLLAHHLPQAQVMKSLADGTHEAILRTHFGEAYDDISGAVKSLAAKASAPKKRRVFILPGIMASLIGVPKKNDSHVKWLDPIEVAAGTLFKLSYAVTPLWGSAVGPLMPCYVMLNLRLQLAGHEVEIVDYDWRHKLEDLGALLAKRINEDVHDKITLVCHSMGGLVARAALQGDAAANKKVELVVQMGTPNLGAPGLAQAIRGTYPAVTQLAALDPKHSTEDYGKLCASFPGVYGLVPPADVKVFGLNLRDPSIWPKDGVQPSAELLSSCGKTQDTLLKPDARFNLIAGANLETVTGFHKQGDNFVYEYGYAGDGTVPHTSSNMPGIAKIWYADKVAHTSLCIDPSPCDAAAAILEGKSPSLPTKPALKKEGVVKTETDASLLKGDTLLRVEGDASHLFEAMHASLSKVEGEVQTVHAGLKKAGSWLKKHL